MKILFVCTANACRSQMAEGWARVLAPAGWQVASAGLIPHPVSRRAAAVMAEAGVDLGGHRAKALEAVDLTGFDLVMTLSEESGRFLPPLRAGQIHRHHPVTDPMEAVGTPQEVREAFRLARDEIRDLVAQIVAEFTGRG